MLGDARLAADFADDMLERGIYVIGFSFPVVPKGSATPTRSVSFLRVIRSPSRCLNRNITELRAEANVNAATINAFRQLHLSPALNGSSEILHFYDVITICAIGALESATQSAVATIPYLEHTLSQINDSN